MEQDLLGLRLPVHVRTIPALSWTGDGGGGLVVVLVADIFDEQQ